ncbi:hypothetical protein Gohar_014905 [Gossypium harknessii]|uniref:Alpha-N-acetylglucosaminidase n=1 Tax=Gossypium harknessii TaxID=34285 RepID=A0A7J9FYL7_9ROSI|nr:hypothetical protein [Gossypium harknessii]
MDSSLAAISLLLFSLFSMVYASTIGVQYISKLLQIQERERAPPSFQVAAARGVLHRLLPSHSSAFEFRIISKEKCGGEGACFIIDNHPSSYKSGAPEIFRISGVTGVEVLAGLHWYLKYWCGSHISWQKTGGAQLFSIPPLGSLPPVQDGGILVQRPIPWNYYQNAVTSSYTFAWWDWERWEQEIDWMALQGINLPLAFTGQETIWRKVFQISGIDGDRMPLSLHPFTGYIDSVFFPFYAGLTSGICIECCGFESNKSQFNGRWGGPLPESWFDGQLTLQKKILARMYELGMTPVLPAFSGNVPAAFKDMFPSAKITRLGNCDTFDENTPPVDDPGYISSLGAAILSGMQSGDDNAMWLMQALLHSVPLGKLVVLDLYAEVKPIWISSEQFYGVPYIWKVIVASLLSLYLTDPHLCMLHNFAGNIEMYGILDALASGPIEALTSENSTMVGIGMSMEGIEQNPIVYDLMSEMAFQHKKVDVKDKNRDVIVAFPDVNPSLISSTLEMYPHNGKPTSRRAILREKTNAYEQPHLWYSTSEVIKALELFIASGNELSASNTYSYDLVDLTRQSLAKYANELFLKIIDAYKFKDVDKVTSLSQKFLDLVEDMDTLLACHDGFLLGPWLESAKQLAQNEEEEKQFEWNARTQITMWFDNTEEEASLLRDYGNKYWSGLLRDYYGPRAAIYFKILIESVENGEDFKLHKWRREWIKLTNNWQSSRKLFPVKSSGNAVSISRSLYNKYLRSES